MKLVGVTLVTLVGSVLLFSMPAWSDSKGKKDKEADTKVTDLVKDATITIDQAIKTATEKVQGTVVEAELEKEHGKTVWEVEVLGADGHFYRRQVEGFADSVLSGAPMRGADIADGVANIKTMVAIAHSVASGKIVEVESAKGAL